MKTLINHNMCSSSISNNNITKKLLSRKAKWIQDAMG